MKFSKILCMVIFVSMSISIFAACGSNGGTGKVSAGSSPANSTEAATNTSQKKQAEPVKLTYFNTSAEVNTMFEDMFKAYNTLKPNVTIELIPTGVGQGQQEKLQSLYASGNAPTMANIDPANVIEYQDKLVEFSVSADKWLDLAQPGVLDAGTFDGKLLGIPFTTQGYGLLYNKKVIEKAIGGTFDPSSIKTRNDLEDLFKKIAAAGISPAMFHGANWSLGQHYLGLVYAAQSRDVSGGLQFIENLKAGKVDLINDPVFNGYMDTFDLIAKYNLRKKDPLVADYNKDTQDFAQGKCATFFMGDWSWTVIGALKERDNEFGVIPVPLSNNPEDFGNTQIPVTLPKLMTIDKSQSSAGQQAAAKEFLAWMMTDEKGQKFFTDTGFVMPYKNAKTENMNPMSTSVSSYAESGATINLSCFAYLSGDHWEKNGASMQKYLVGKIDRKGLAKEVEAYWKSKAGK